MSHIRKYRVRYLAGLAAILVVGASAGVYIGTSSHTPYTPGGADAVQALADFYAPRDLGRLPARNNWCTIARTADHCWLLQETSGNAIDTGAASPLWTMAAENGPRQGVLTPLPIADATGWIDITTERGIWSQGAGFFRVPSSVDNLPDATNLVSVTLIAVSSDTTIGNNNKQLFGAEDTSTDGYAVTLASGGNIRLRINGSGGGSVLFSTATAPMGIGTVHCITAVFDGRTASSGALYVDGDAHALTPNNDMSGTGSWQESLRVALLTHPAGSAGSARPKGGVLRARVDFAALSQGDHQAICGTLWDPPSTATAPASKVAPADSTWTQTGAPRCYASSATTALCIPGGVPGYAYSAALGGIGWPLEPDRINRVMTNVNMSSAVWSGPSGGVTAVLAPDGSFTAWSAAVTDVDPLDANDAIGYGPSASLNFRVWARCSTGLLRLTTTSGGSGTGRWDVSCSTLGGNWTELYTGHAAVTQVTPWAAHSSGKIGLRVTSDATGTTAELWLPTFTQTAGISVIPTADSAAAATGTIAWQIDNSAGKYYTGRTGRITMVGDWVAGGCIDVTSGTNAGRQYSDGADWFAYDTAAALVYQCNLPLSGADTGVIRWNHSASVDYPRFAQCLLNAAPQTFDTTPLARWTFANPTAIQLSGQAATSCTARLSRFTVENGP